MQHKKMNRQKTKTKKQSSDHYQIPNYIINIFLFLTAAHICGLLRPARAHRQITVQKLLCLSEHSVKFQFHKKTYAQQHIYIWRSRHCNTKGTKGTGGGDKRPNILRWATIKGKK